MFRSSIKINSITLLVAIGFTNLNTVFCSKKEKTIQPSLMPKTEAVYALGYLVPWHEIKVYSLIHGHITGIFKDLSNLCGQAIIAVTHDREFAAKSARIIEMHDGRILNGLLL